MKRLIYILSLPVLLVVIYFAGPKYHSPQYNKTLPEINLSGQDLENFVNARESKFTDMKKDNEARIVWADDSLKEKTPYAVVYLHGFSASQGEGYPVHTDFARRYGCNLYLARLYDHGLNSPNALLHMHPDSLVYSAGEAIAIGKQLGDKVILISTSTGGTLSLYLAGGDPDIAGLILFSPNIKVNNPFIFLLTGPWGLQIGRLFAGGENIVFPIESREDSLYWNASYRVEALIYMQSLLDKTMNRETFGAVTQPVFLGYYYKDEKHQDPTCRVESMRKMYDELGTPGDEKVKEAFPDAGEHVIACEYKSKDWKGVEQATYRFAEDVLGMKPVGKE